jgi:hypothetical protein
MLLNITYSVIRYTLCHACYRKTLILLCKILATFCNKVVTKTALFFLLFKKIIPYQDLEHTYACMQKGNGTAHLFELIFNIYM